MSVYAIGDVHGCSRTLRALLERLPLERSSDRLWLVGDLVGHGPDSVGVLSLVRDLSIELGDRLVLVLGNHDLRLIAARDGVAVPSEVVGLCREVLKAPDGRALIAWLAEQPLLHASPDHLLVHAGLLPWWTTDEAAQLAREARTLLSSDRRAEILRAVYAKEKGDGPPAELRRAVQTVRVMTTIRAIKADGEICDHKGSLETAPPGCDGWFEYPDRAHCDAVVVFGHWASLGLRFGDRYIALDSGCAWGGPLSAVRLDDLRLFQVPRSD
jgi:bis(5'-nucleosyl)-tetraphosphatase (symmetrical)